MRYIKINVPTYLIIRIQNTRRDLPKIRQSLLHQSVKLIEPELKLLKVFPGQKLIIRFIFDVAFYLNRSLRE